MRKDTSYFKTFSKMIWLFALLLVVFTAGCDRDHGGAADDGGLGPAICLGPGPLDMGAAATFGVLVGPAGGATLTVTNPTTVTGDVGAASYVPAGGPTTVSGTKYTGVDVPFVNAKAAMLAAISCADARPCDFSYGVATDFATVIGLAPGVHCVTGGMSVGSNLTLGTPGV